MALTAYSPQCDKLWIIFIKKMHTVAVTVVKDLTASSTTAYPLHTVYYQYKEAATPQCLKRLKFATWPTSVKLAHADPRVFLCDKAYPVSIGNLPLQMGLPFLDFSQNKCFPSVRPQNAKLMLNLILAICSLPTLNWASCVHLNYPHMIYLSFYCC